MNGKILASSPFVIQSCVMLPITIFCSLFCFTRQAEILAILPFFGASHFYVFEPILDELSQRGHRLTVASYFPKSLPNYTSISLYDGEVFRSFLSFDRFEGERSTVFSKMRLLYDATVVNEKILKKLCSMEFPKFDLVIAEMFNTDVFFGLIYKIGAPYILLSASDSLPWHSYSIGDSLNPSFVKPALLDGPLRMGILDRLVNTFEIYLAVAGYEIFFRWNEQKLAEKYLGSLPPLRDIAKNASLYLVHWYSVMHSAKPLMPNSIQFGGINVKQPKPLPKDLKKIMDESQGVIYFSMGSVLKGDSLHDKKQQAFIKVFSELKQTVLWKRESPLSVNVKNIVTNGWYPQRDILAHPKVELFITHFGLLGTNEAVSSGVPMVGIPMFGDQHHNGKALESIGVAVSLDFNELNEDNIREAINKVLRNPSFVLWKKSPEKPDWAKKDITFYSDADMERLLEQWEEDDEPLEPDELPEHLRPKPQIDISNLGQMDPENLQKMSKKGQTVMAFVVVNGEPDRDRTEQVTKLWQGSLHNSHIQAERYVIEDNRVIFMYKDGSQAWDGKDFLIEQPECKEVMIEGKTYPGKHAKNDSLGEKDEL